MSTYPGAIAQADLDAPDCKAVVTLHCHKVSDQHPQFTRAMYCAEPGAYAEWDGLYWHWVFYKIQCAKVQNCYYSASGTLLNLDGTRSIFDDLDD